MRSRFQKVLFVFFILFLISIGFIFSRFFDGLEVYGADWKQLVSLDTINRLKTDDSVRDKIIILSIDDLTSFDLSNHPYINIDRWPLGRKTWSEIIDFIEKGNPKTLSIAVPFQNYEDITLSASSSDLIFSNTLSKYKNIVIGTFLNTPQDISKNAPLTVLMDRIDNPFKPVKKSLNINFLSADISGKSTFYSYLPVPEIFVNNTSIAFMNLLQEDDSVVRFSHPVSKVVRDNEISYMPSFAFATFLKYINYDGPININQSRLFFNNYSVPLSKNSGNYINWIGKSRTYQYIPLSKIIIGMKTDGKTFEYKNIKYPVEFFKDKIVIISPTQTNADTLNTSIEQGITSAEINATIIENYITDSKLDNPLRRKFIRDVPLYASILVTFGFCTLIIVNTIVFRSSLLSLFNSVLLIVAYIIFNVYVFCRPDLRINLPLIHPIYLMFVSLISSYIYVLIEESTRKHEIVNIFGKFVSENVLNKLLKNSQNFSLKTDKKKVTVMFCDVANFTSIIEKYPVEEVVEKLNEIFKIATQKIFKYQGTIDKFIGDAVMAYWGEPIPSVNDALNAVKAAVEIIEAVDEMNNENAEDEIKLSVKISISTGEALVGCIGTDKIVDYTVLGDTVNIAARIESICSQFNKKLLISENTYKEVDHFIQADYAGNIKLKGKDSGVNIYAPRLVQDDD